MTDARALVEAVRDACAPHGMDLVAGAPLAAYNARVAPDYALPDLGRPGGDALVVVVGNTRALWPAFAAARASDPRAATDDPLDAWVDDVLTPIAQALGPRHALRYAWERPPRAFHALRLAAVAGLAHEGPAWLAVHPQHGPWFALRAALVLDVDPPPPAAPAPDPCTPCARACVTALNEAFARGPAATWRDWLAARDACPIGRAARYDDDQLAYHYTKDPGFLPSPHPRVAR